MNRFDIPAVLTSLKTTQQLLSNKFDSSIQNRIANIQISIVFSVTTGANYPFCFFTNNAHFANNPPIVV